MKIVVVTAGTGQPSATAMLGQRLSQATVAALAGKRVEVVEIELRGIANQVLARITTGLINSRLQEAIDQIRTADGVIAVSPIFNGSYSGLFKMFFDAIDEGLMASRPVLMAATGGTARHSLAIDHAMLPMFYYLKAVPAPHPVFAATRDWGESEGRLQQRIDRAAAAFARLVTQASPVKQDTEFDVSDFTNLLGGE